MKRKKPRAGRIILCLILLALIVLTALSALSSTPVTGETTMTWLKNTPVAHRGLHTEAVSENSLAAFADAMDAGYAIEFDLRLSADGEIMVIHDDSLIRVSGQPGKVSQLSAAEVQSYTLYAGGHVPTFRETLEQVQGRAPLLIELKPASNSHELVDKMIPMLDGYGGEFAIQSFDPYLCRYVKSLRPDWQVGLLDYGLGFGPAFLRLALDKALFRVCHPDFISYRYQALLPGMLDEYRAQGTAVLAYGTHESDIGKDFWQDRTDNLIFDREPLHRRK